MIDRTIQPPVSETGKPDMLVPDTNRLSNGLPVHILNAGTQEVTRLDFCFDAGLWYENKPLQAALSNAMLQEGSLNYSGAQLAEIMDFHGAYIQFAVDHHQGVISLISLNKHLPKLLPVVEDLVKHSLMEAHEVETMIRRRKQRFLLENEKVKVLCQKKFSSVLFGDEHPYAQTVQLKDFEAITRGDLLGFYACHYRSENCRILASGKTDPNLIDLLDKHFGDNDWQGLALDSRRFFVQPSSQKEQRVVKQEAIQSAIRIGRLLVKKDHPDYLGLQVLNTLLGGYFSSRLMANIREEKGYTYGIGSSVVGLKEAGYWVIATETDQSYEEATIREVFLEMKKLREELVSEAELYRVRQYLLGEFVRDFDGPFAQAQSFQAVADFGLDHRFYEQYYQTLLTIQPADLQALAQKYLQQEDFYTVVAGA
ncbi:pitrilysin family protein [uncultured Sunxiuqinia sp.]|uniref:M16 family metallopeptidase n=1 Tax=uncultured Sunxiuqinia sp. TaxID=1573825 RepID=UPI002631462D|nr:pitrilysin family protein [uncultured Sunxiuqinia sp.]